MVNPFFKNFGPFKISDLLKAINLQKIKFEKDDDITDI